MLIDTHCHIDFECFDNKREQILAQCQLSNIKHIIVPSINSSGWEKTLNLCADTTDTTDSNKSPNLLACLGLHPIFLKEHSAADLIALEKYCEQEKICAIGEIGLDFFIQTLIREEQLFYFESQLILAKKYHLPVLIHARKSHQDIIQLLRKYQPLKGIIHAFNGSEVQAQQYIELGFKLGFGGAFTYLRAKHLRRLVANLPLTSMVLETDAPDMLPAFATQKYNSPENLVGIFKEFVLLRSENKNEIENQLEQNVSQVLPVI